MAQREVSRKRRALGAVLLVVVASCSDSSESPADHSGDSDASDTSALDSGRSSGTRRDTGAADAGRTGGAGGASGSAGAIGAGGSSGRTGSGGMSSGGDSGEAETGVTSDAGTSEVTPGWNLVAIDAPLRTYLAYVEVPASGTWTPDSGYPLLAQWQDQSTYSALRFQTFTPGDVLTPVQIIQLLPELAVAATSISITDAPYHAAVAPADASDAIQAALDAAADMAAPGSPVDVLVPPGTFNHSKVLTLGPDVRLRRSPEDSGGVLHATDPAHEAVHLQGDRSAALFLVLSAGATARDTTPESSGIWVAPKTPNTDFIHDAMVVGTEVTQAASAHFFAISEDSGLWAFNYAHDGYADTFHHTGRSRFCQVIGNRAQTSAERGDDFYAFVGYQGDGDPVHHCSCIANWARDGHARGLSAVGAGFIAFEHNDIDRTQWAGIYLAQEDSYTTYGTFDISVIGNSIAHANLNGSHDGLIAFSDHPDESHDATSFGSLSSQVRRLTIQDNTFSDTAPGVGNGFGIEIRASVDSGDVSGNTLAGNKPPQLVLDGSNFTSSANDVVP